MLLCSIDPILSRRSLKHHLCFFFFVCLLAVCERVWYIGHSTTYDDHNYMFHSSMQCLLLRPIPLLSTISQVEFLGHFYLFEPEGVALAKISLSLSLSLSLSWQHTCYKRRVYVMGRFLGVPQTHTHTHTHTHTPSVSMEWKCDRKKCFRVPRLLHARILQRHDRSIDR